MELIKEDISTIIIAGGKGRRFGRPKYDVIFKGRRLVDIAVEFARQFGGRISVACGSFNCNLSGGIRTFNDIISGCGPLGGIYSALHYSETQWILIMPVDMPNLSVEIYNILSQNIIDERSPVAAVSNKGLEPLVSIWPRSAVNQVEKMIKAGNYSIRDCLKALRFKAVKINGEHNENKEDPFYNINTQQDLIIKPTD